MATAHLNRTRIRPKGGKREDLDGLFVRSSMEANLCRIFEYLKARAVIIEWWYEPHTFQFAGLGPYSRGPWAYTPDMLVKWNHVALAKGEWPELVPGTRPVRALVLPAMTHWNKRAREVYFDHNPTEIPYAEYFEVKGREMPSDRSKAKRMKTHYPDVQITTIGAPEYKALTEVWSRMISNWEGAKCRRR